VPTISSSLPARIRKLQEVLSSQQQPEQRGAASLDDVIYDLPTGTIPFSFTFNSVAYTGCKISTNGFITFGTTAPSANGSTTGYTPLSATHSL
jgi:hypothetical protein